MIWASPWDVPSGPSAPVAPALGSWAIGSEEDGVLGVLPFSLARMRLMCHSGARFVADCGSWRWIMQRFHVLELLDGEMDLPKLGGVGSRQSSVIVVEDGGEALEGLCCNFRFYEGLLCLMGMYSLRPVKTAILGLEGVVKHLAK